MTRTKKATTAAAATAVLAVGLIYAGCAEANPPVAEVGVECNWGHLTMQAAGPEHGKHAADPEGDGVNNPDYRVGLANVLYQGDLEAVCIFIETLLEESQ